MTQCGQRRRLQGNSMDYEASDEMHMRIADADLIIAKGPAGPAIICRTQGLKDTFEEMAPEGKQRATVKSFFIPWDGTPEQLDAVRRLVARIKGKDSVVSRRLHLTVERRLRRGLISGCDGDRWENGSGRWQMIR